MGIVVNKGVSIFSHQVTLSNFIFVCVCVCVCLCVCVCACVFLLVFLLFFRKDFVLLNLISRCWKKLEKGT